MASPQQNHQHQVGPAPVADMAIDHNWQPFQPFQPCFLFSMPGEILLKIFAEVIGSDNDRASLARLAETCKALSIAITPILYHDIQDRYVPAGQANNTGRLRALSLLVSLWNHHHLRTWILFLDFANPSFHQFPANIHLNHHYHSIIEQLFGIPRNVQPPAELLDPSQPGFLANPILEMALLALAPHLTTLNITYSTDRRTTDFLLVKNNTNRVIGTRFAHHNLTTLTINFHPHPSRQTGTNLHKLNGLFHCLPHLATLSIAKPRGGTSLTARLPNLTSLTLTNAFLSPRALRNLLRGCVHLIHFHFAHDPFDVRFSRAPPVSPGQVAECLVPAARSLRRVYIRAWEPEGQELARVQGQHRGRGYPLLEGLGGVFTGLRQVAVGYQGLERRGFGFGRWGVLVELLRGCVELEGVVFMGVGEFEEREFDEFAKEVGRVYSIWPRLRAVRVQSRGKPVGTVEQVREWAGLQAGMGRLRGRMAAMRARGFRVEVLSKDVVTGAFVDE